MPFFLKVHKRETRNSWLASSLALWLASWLAGWLTHSLTHSLTHPPTHSFTHSANIFSKFAGSNYRKFFIASFSLCLSYPILCYIILYYTTLYYIKVMSCMWKVNVAKQNKAIFIIIVRKTLCNQNI